MPACIICKTLEGDVKKGLEELNRCDDYLIDALKESETPNVVQVGMRKYDNLKKANRDDVIEELEKKHITHILNYKTLAIHRKNCPHAGKKTVTAYVVNDCVTGLRKCKHCM